LIEISEKQDRIRKIIDEYGITKNDLEEYRRNRPLRESEKKLEHTVEEKAAAIAVLKIELIRCESKLYLEENPRAVSEIEFDEANKRLPIDRPLEMKELVEITDEIFYNPSRNVDIIKLMRKRFGINPKKIL
jgi:hypothetical protein